LLLECAQVHHEQLAKYNNRAITYDTTNGKRQLTDNSQRQLTDDSRNSVVA